MGAIAVAIAVSHQLTPYAAVLVLVILVVAGYARPLWSPLLVLVPALGWAAVRSSIVGNYVSVKQLGRVANLAPPVTNGASVLHRLPIVALSSVGIGGGVVLLALAGLVAFVLLRSRVQLVFFACGVSALVVGVANAYGNEAIFRAVLFAGPWLGLLAATLALAPEVRARLLGRALVPLMVVTFLFGEYGLDASNSIRPGDLSALRYFEQWSAPGSVLLAVGTGNLPVLSTSHYPGLTETTRSGAGGWPGTPSTYSASADSLGLSEELLHVYPRPLTSHWALWSPTQVTYDQEYAVATPTEEAALEAALTHSSYWKERFADGGTVLFQLVGPPPSGLVVVP